MRATATVSGANGSFTATVEPFALPVGQHQLVVRFAGDETHAPAAAPPITATVVPGRRLTVWFPLPAAAHCGSLCVCVCDSSRAAFRVQRDRCARHGLIAR